MNNPLHFTLALSRNRLGILVVGAALVALIAANLLPFLHIGELEDRRSYTILGGVMELFRHDDSLLATAIFVFSFLFPFVKLLMLVPATGFPWQFSDEVRARLIRTALWLGKYSMLDVFVGAVMIVAVRIQGDPMLRTLISVETGNGLQLFLIAWLLSAAAGNLMIIPGVNHNMTSSSLADRISANRPGFGNKLAIVGLFLILAGAGIVLLSPSAEDVAIIRAVRLIEKPGINISLLSRRQHDLYLELKTFRGTIRTRTEARAVIGNGLTIPLPERVPFRDILTVAAWDARDSTVWGRLHSPQQIDRVDELGMSTAGTRFQFRMEPIDEIRLARWIPLLFGDTVAGLGLICLVWWAFSLNAGIQPGRSTR